LLPVLFQSQALSLSPAHVAHQDLAWFLIVMEETGEPSGGIWTTQSTVALRMSDLRGILYPEPYLLV
jgi:hypothetical protein